MSGLFRVDGAWPSPVTITQGWGRAAARPWNDEARDAFLRLERGRAQFLRSATEHIASLSGSGVFSPAMFVDSTKVWTRAGYEEVRQLDVMERSLRAEADKPSRQINQTVDPDWSRILEIDRGAFKGFWRMSEEGLREALGSTSPSVVLTIPSGDDQVLGYAIVGSQWGTAYLQRVAVDPTHAGQGIGTDLIRGSVGWARTTSAISIVLNVRPENSQAVRLYERHGFTTTERNLRILRYGDTTLLGQ